MVCAQSDRMSADSLSPVGHNGEIRSAIGCSAINAAVYTPFRPSVLSLANEFALVSASDGVPLEQLIPIPNP